MPWLYCVFAQARLSCRFFTYYFSWHIFQIVLLNSCLKKRISYEHFSCEPILACNQTVLFYTYHCGNNTQDIENVYENNDLSYFENIAIPF